VSDPYGSAGVFLNIAPRIISLIISPTPLIAANFIILGRLIAKVGPEYSRLNPRLCTSRALLRAYVELTGVQTLASSCPAYGSLLPIIHSSANSYLQDLVALVIQAAGGAIASTSNTPSGSSLVSAQCIHIRSRLTWSCS
jgi:hypothetical protein